VEISSALRSWISDGIFRCFDSQGMHDHAGIASVIYLRPAVARSSTAGPAEDLHTHISC
jgi:hypothetical protein